MPWRKAGVGGALVVLVVTAAFGVLSLRAGLALGLLATIVALPARQRRFMARRFISTLVTIFLAMAVVFLLIHNLPDASRLDETGFVAAMRAYGEWLGDLVVGDLGDSSYSETVTEGVARTIPLSFQLLLYSQVIAVLVALPAALLAARRRGGATDVLVRLGAFFGISMPIIVVGPVLVVWLAVGGFSVFGVDIGGRWLPSGRPSPFGDGIVDHFKAMLLPSLSLAIGSIAAMLVVFRSNLIIQLQQDHAMLARSKGISSWRVVWAHAARPAAPTLASLIAAQTAIVVGNLVIVERLFLLPGFGDYVLVAFGRRDVQAVFGGMFVMVCIIAGVNLIADAFILALDPRIEVDDKPMWSWRRR